MRRRHCTDQRSPVGGRFTVLTGALGSDMGGRGILGFGLVAVTLICEL